MARKPMRNKPRDNGRRTKKKVSVLNTEKIEYSNTSITKTSTCFAGSCPTGPRSGPDE